MNRVKRTDLAPSPLRPAETLPSGFRKYDAFIGRTGPLEYVAPDGTPYVEFRPDAEAFRPETLASFEALPLTNNHPAEGALSLGNVRLNQVGQIGKVVRDGDFMRTTIVVTDPATIALIDAGKVELSMGYTCDAPEESGTAPDGTRYQYVQRNIVGNHVALVDRGRAGATVALRADDVEVIDTPVTDRADAIEQRFTARAYYELAAARLDELSELPRPAYEQWQRDDALTTLSTPPVPLSERMRLLCADISRDAHKRPSDIRTRRADGSELSSAEIDRERKRAHRDLYRVRLGGDE